MPRIVIYFTIVFFSLTINIFGQDNKTLNKQARNYQSKAIKLSEKGNYDSSFIYYRRAAKLYKKTKDTLSVAACQINMAKAYRDLGQYENSLRKLFDVLPVLESCCKDQENRLPYLSSCYTTLASVHRKSGNYDKASEYYQLILQHTDTVKGESVRSIRLRTLNNLGNLHLSMRNFHQAKEFLEKALTISLEDSHSYALALNNLAIANFHLGNYTEAKKGFLHALKLKEQLGNQKSIAVTLNQLGKLFLSKGEYDRSFHYLQRSKKILDEIQTLDLMVEHQRIMVDFLKQTHNTKKLIPAYERYILLKDSLLNREKAESLAEMQVRYETEKKQQQISLLMHEKKLQAAAIELKQYWIISLFAGLFMVLIIVSLVYHRFRREKSSKQKIETLMQELQHRIKNNLQTLSSLLSLQTRTLSDEKAIAAIKSGESRINAMAVIHQQLNGSQKYTQLNIRDYIFNIIEYLTQTYGHENDHMRICQDIPSVDLDVDMVIPLGLIVNELISNSFKYAFPNHPNPRLEITMAIPDHKTLFVSIKDNGPGLNDRQTGGRKGALGQQIVHTLTKQLKGSLTQHSNEGLEVKLRIPINKK